MKKPAFNDYLRTRPVTDDPEGDFVFDACRDPKFPNVTSWAQLRSYLSLRASPVIVDDVLSAARAVWDDYKAEKQIAPVS